MITKKKSVTATLLDYWRSLNFSCYTTSQSNANTRLRKASSSPKIEWRETRCLAERGRGRGSAGAGASVPAQRCRQIRLFRTLHTSSASFAARSFKDRVSANVLGAGKASDTCFFWRVSTARSGAVFSEAPRLPVRWSQISCVHGSAGTGTKLLVPLYACSCAGVTGLYFV